MVGLFSKRRGYESPTTAAALTNDHTNNDSSSGDGDDDTTTNHAYDDADDHDQRPKRGRGGLTLRNAKAHHSPDAYPGVRFLVPKAQCHRLNTRGARIDAEACMHVRGDTTLTLGDLELGFMFSLLPEDGGSSRWVQLRSARLRPRGRRARVVLEVMV